MSDFKMRFGFTIDLNEVRLQDLGALLDTLYAIEDQTMYTSKGLGKNITDLQHYIVRRQNQDMKDFKNSYEYRIKLLEPYMKKGNGILNEGLGISFSISTSSDNMVKHIAFMDKNDSVFDSCDFGGYEKKDYEDLIVQLQRELERLERCKNLNDLEQFFEDYLGGYRVTYEEYKNRDLDNIYVGYYVFTEGYYRVDY